MGRVGDKFKIVRNAGEKPLRGAHDLEGSPWQNFFTDWGGVAYAAGFLGVGGQCRVSGVRGEGVYTRGFICVALNSRGMRLIRDGRFALELLV